MMEERDKWMNEEALQRDMEIIVEKVEIRMERMEDFQHSSE